MKYELTYIALPNLSEEDLSKLIAKINDLIVNNGGEVKEQKAPIKQKLAYPIKKNKNGSYITIEFLIEPEKVSSIDKILRIESSVLRHIIIALPEKAQKTKKVRKNIPAEVIIPETIKSKPVKKQAVKEKVKIEELDKKLEELLQ